MRHRSRMCERRRCGRRALPLSAFWAFLAFWSVLAGWPHAASAQFSSVGSSDHKQDRNAPMVFQADEVAYDNDLALTVARGHVEIAQGGQVLLADTVSYNQRTDTVTASGNVSLMQPTGEVMFADFMELHDNMSEAFAKNVRMLLSDRSRLAANTARRTAGNRTELRRGVYSPCDLCKDDPTAPPLWQLKAREMNHDKENHIIEYRDTVMEIDGWPVFWTPYMTTPDPSVKRQTGFLPPSIGSSSNTGQHVTIPFFWVLGPDKDVTIAPRFTTKAGAILAGEYRERFSNGTMQFSGSLNRSSIKLSDADDTPQPYKWRGHLFGNGEWDLDETWRTGFQIQRASDQTYLTRFGFGTPYANSLITRTYLEGFEERASTDVNSYIFQPLRSGLIDQTQPIVTPVINRNWQSLPDSWGGRLNVNANLLNIVRETGTQTRRVSVGSQWDKSFDDGIGGRYRFLARLRGDAYSVNNLSLLSNPDLPAGYFSVNGAAPANPISHNLIAGRVFPQIGLEWSYPLMRRGESFSELIEPVTAIYAGPSGGNRRRIPNEDSLSFDFNDADLFRPNRLPGYDVLDTGQRVDYGLRLGLYQKDGGSSRFVIGQSYRAQDNPFLPTGSGAERRLSDVVGRLTVSPNSYIDMVYRFRLARGDLSNRSQQVGISGGPNNLRVGMNYLLLPAERQTTDLASSTTTTIYGKRQQLSVDVAAKLTQYWTLRGTETFGLTNSTISVNGLSSASNAGALYSTLAAIYQDECLAFIGSITQSKLRDRDITPGISVLFTVVFKNLGEVGGNVFSVSPGGTL